MTPPDIMPVTSAHAEEWNTFVEANERGSTFHRYEWRQFYHDSYRHDTPFLGAFHAGRLVGVLPLVRVRTPWFGHYLVSNPYVSYGGPLGDDATQLALSAAAVKLANGAKLVELRSRAPIATTLTPAFRKITVLLDLVPGDYDATFKTLDSKLRSQVRRAAKEGLRVQFGPEQIGAFHPVFAEHMRDLGSPAHSAKFFRDLARMLGSRAWIGVAYLGDEPVACGFAITNGTEVEISWASALRRHAKIAPNMALYGAFIQRACEDGFQAFNFGRCTPGSGTHRFKRQWGSRDETLCWYQHSTTAESAPPNPDQSKFQMAVKVWRQLPRMVTDRLGPPLIRGIP